MTRKKLQTPVSKVAEAVGKTLADAVAARQVEPTEPSILGKPVRQLSDAQLDAATALQTEKATDAMGAVHQAITNALNAVSLTEILHYEQGRRKAK